MTGTISDPYIDDDDDDDEEEEEDIKEAASSCMSDVCFVPGSILLPDLVRCSRLRSSATLTVAGTIRIKNNETNMIPAVAMETKRRNAAVSPGNRREVMEEKKNALRPYAANGNAVAVPL